MFLQRWVYLRMLSLEWNPHCKQFLPWSKFGAWRPFEDIEEEHYLHYQEMFTDGSKNTNQVCAATIFLSSKLAFSSKLPHITSIFTAELLAIQLALSNIHKTNCNFHILFSDSQSALQAINHNCSKNPIVLDILLKYPVQWSYQPPLRRDFLLDTGSRWHKR